MARKMSSQSAKKVPLGLRAFRTVFLLLATPYVNILIGAQDFCWPKIINQLGQKPAFGGFLSCVGINTKRELLRTIIWADLGGFWGLIIGYQLDPFDPKRIGFCDLVSTPYAPVSKISSANVILMTKKTSLTVTTQFRIHFHTRKLEK